MEAGVATTGSAAGANWLEGQGNTGWSASSYHLKPRSATGDLGALAGPREITSPLAFHGEPSAAQKALPDVAQCPFPWVPPHAGLSRWAVSCPNRALRWRHENPAPGRPAPREGNTDTSIHPIASTSNLVPQPRTWGSLLAHEKSRHHWLFVVSRRPPGRPCLMLQNAPSHGLPLRLG